MGRLHNLFVGNSGVCVLHRYILIAFSLIIPHIAFLKSGVLTSLATHCSSEFSGYRGTGIVKNRYILPTDINLLIFLISSIEFFLLFGYKLRIFQRSSPSSVSNNVSFTGVCSFAFPEETTSVSSQSFFDFFHDGCAFFYKLRSLH